MERRRGNEEGGNLSLSPFPFSLHFLILSPFPRSLAARLPQVVTSCTHIIHVDDTMRNRGEVSGVVTGKCEKI